MHCSTLTRPCKVGDHRPSASKSAYDREKSPSEKSWSQKRKETLIARASGERREPDALATSLATAEAEREAKEALKKTQEKKDPSEKEYHELTWREKRARNFGLTHGVPVKVPEVEVAVTSVLFAAKLKARLAASKQQQPAAEEGAEAEPPKLKKKASGEVGWKQQRKEAYMRKYGIKRAEETTQADVAVTALRFAAKLKMKASASATGTEAPVNIE